MVDAHLPDRYRTPGRSTAGPETAFKLSGSVWPSNSTSMVRICHEELAGAIHFRFFRALDENDRVRRALGTRHQFGCGLKKVEIFPREGTNSGLSPKEKKPNSLRAQDHCHTHAQVGNGQHFGKK